MRLGILADIHEDVPKLTLALQRLGRAGVRQVVLLGDLVDTGRHLQATVALLAEAGAVGVWGNHDLGLCHEPEEPFEGGTPGRSSTSCGRCGPGWNWRAACSPTACPAGTLPTP
jgi:predicted phosphodiesterase